MHPRICLLYARPKYIHLNCLKIPEPSQTKPISDICISNNPLFNSPFNFPYKGQDKRRESILRSFYAFAQNCPSGNKRQFSNFNTSYEIAKGYPDKYQY